MKYYLLLISLIIYGCAPTIIRLDSRIDNEALEVFGKNSERSFFTDIIINDTPKLIWSNSTYGSYTSTSFTVYDGNIFLSDLSGRVSTFNINTGKQTGQYKIKGSISVTPIVNNFLLIFPYVIKSESNSVLVFYDFKQGKIAIEKNINGVITSELVFKDKQIYGVTERGLVFCYSQFGEIIWETKIENEFYSSPALKNEILILASNDGKIYGINIKNGEIIFINKVTENSFNAGISIIDNNILIGDTKGKVFRINYQTGTLIDKFQTNGKILANISADNDNYYFGNTAGEIYSLTKNGLKLNWKLETKGLFNTPVLVTKNKLILNEFGGELLFIDKNGNNLNKLTKNIRMKMTPVIYKNKLLIGFDNGKIEVYEIN